MSQTNTAASTIDTAILMLDSEPVASVTNPGTAAIGNRQGGPTSSQAAEAVALGVCEVVLLKAPSGKTAPAVGTFGKQARNLPSFRNGPVTQGIVLKTATRGMLRVGYGQYCRYIRQYGAVSASPARDAADRASKSNCSGMLRRWRAEEASFWC